MEAAWQIGSEEVVWQCRAAAALGSQQKVWPWADSLSKAANDYLCVTWNEFYVNRVEAVFSVWLSTFAWLNKQTKVE